MDLKEFLLPADTPPASTKKPPRPKSMKINMPPAFATENLKEVFHSFLTPEIEIDTLSRIQWQIEAYFIEQNLEAPFWLKCPPPDPGFEDNPATLNQNKADMAIQELEIMKEKRKSLKLQEIYKIQQPYERKSSTLKILNEALIVETSKSKKKLSRIHISNPFSSIKFGFRLNTNKKNKGLKKENNMDLDVGYKTPKTQDAAKTENPSVLPVVSKKNRNTKVMEVPPWLDIPPPDPHFEDQIASIELKTSNQLCPNCGNFYAR
ncbi:hypothetical protein BB561_002761 [Smittium simulii]|uniref:Uncharacterized protein n=1 Tax=Smittium simulii TaxID=133385 RepID=A0A2T9YPD0_9FUNG|nr:hypothetical protein BB561_002761 [Smittium simulii]